MWPKCCLDKMSCTSHSCTRTCPQQKKEKSHHKAHLISDQELLIISQQSSSAQDVCPVSWSFFFLSIWRKKVWKQQLTKQSYYRLHFWSFQLIFLSSLVKDLIIVFCNHCFVNHCFSIVTCFSSVKRGVNINILDYCCSLWWDMLFFASQLLKMVKLFRLNFVFLVDSSY